jgi:hypothetical protein
MTTTANLTADQKAAYNKGWASTAKSQDVAVDGFAKKVGDDFSPLLAFFAFGYADKHNGSAKWDSTEAEKLEAAHEAAAAEVTAVEVDGVKVAETTRVDLTEAADAPESDEDLAAEAAAPAEDAVPTEADLVPAADATVWFPKGGVLAPNKGKLFTTIPQLRARIVKGMDKAEVKVIRDEISMKKRHYLMGWNSHLSPIFKGNHDVAEAGYYKRHGAPDVNAYWADWEAGYQDSAKGREKGHAWA